MKAVIFDMDGVIIDSEPVYLEQQLEFARRKNPDVQASQLYPMVGATKKAAWQVLERAINNGESWREIRRQFNEGFSEKDVDYRAIFRPEIKTILSELKTKGYKLALASSTNLPLIYRVVDENGIRDYFDTIVSGGQFKESKPNPEIYHYTASQLAVREEDCLVVEDSTVGITAAHRAGMKIAALIDERFDFDQSLADYRMEHLTEVLDILNEC